MFVRLAFSSTLAIIIVSIARALPLQLLTSVSLGSGGGHGGAQLGAYEAAAAYWHRGVAYDRLGYTLEAIGDFSRVLELDPSNFNAAYARAAAHNRRGAFSEAIADYNLALSKDAEAVALARAAAASSAKPDAPSGRRHGGGGAFGLAERPTAGFGLSAATSLLGLGGPSMPRALRSASFSAPASAASGSDASGEGDGPSSAHAPPLSRRQGSFRVGVDQYVRTAEARARERIEGLASARSVGGGHPALGSAVESGSGGFRPSHASVPRRGSAVDASLLFPQADRTDSLHGHGPSPASSVGSSIGSPGGRSSGGGSTPATSPPPRTSSSSGGGAGALGGVAAAAGFASPPPAYVGGGMIPSAAPPTVFAARTQSALPPAPAVAPAVIATRGGASGQPDGGATGDSDADVHHARGFALRRKGDFHGAIAEYARALEADPGHFKAFFNRGFAHDKLRDFPSAIADYSHALAIDPRNAYAFYNRGISHDRSGDFGAAIEDFTSAIALLPSNADFYHNRGFCHR